VRVIKEKRQGVVYARDTGFDAVKTDLIGRIDSDTILPTGWMQPVVEFYSDNQHQKYALTGGCSFYNVRFSYFVSWCVDQFVFRYNRLLMGHYILYGSNMVITTQQWKDVRNLVCHKIDVHEDLDLAIHLHRIGYEITYREGWKVGVEMRRVLSRRRELWDNIMMWPKTLKHHGKKTWVFGWIGSVFFYLISSLAPLAEWIARVLGHSPLSDD
jgi:glycosyltransferase involved in cell wall biosynthesis